MFNILEPLFILIEGGVGEKVYTFDPESRSIQYLCYELGYRQTRVLMTIVLQN